jgi:hypothetical protein
MQPPGSVTSASVNSGNQAVASAPSRPWISSSRGGLRIRVESRCDAVALGSAYLFPPLSFGGVSLAEPWLRFHIPLIEPDVRY